jgi:hypothetical protein
MVSQLIWCNQIKKNEFALISRHLMVQFEQSFFYCVENIETYKLKNVCPNWTTRWRDIRINVFFLTWLCQIGIGRLRNHRKTTAKLNIYNKINNFNE